MLIPKGKSLRSKPSFAGTGLMERVRSTTFALLGITAAMGLGLVAMIAQQGLPVLPGLPVPGASTEQDGRVHDVKAVAVPSSSPGLGVATPAAADAASGGRVVDAGRDRSDPSDLAGSRQLATAEQPAPSDPGETGAPSEETPPAPTSVDSSPSPAPVTAAAPEPIPASPAPAGTPPGKATAAVAAAGGGEAGSAEDREAERQTRRVARAGRSGSKPSDDEAAIVAAPPPAGDAGADEDAAATADPAPSQTAADEDRARGAGRGPGYRRLGR